MYGLAISVLAYCGLRWSEFAALRADRVDVIVGDCFDPASLAIPHPATLVNRLTMRMVRGVPITRRGFLVASAAVAGGVVLAGSGGVAAGSAQGVWIAQRPLFDGGFPRTFAFRQSEVLAQLRSYAQWAPLFAPLDGIMGKVLQEERTDTVTSRNLAYFNRFKHDYPDAVVLLHYNGRSRLPLYRTATWFAGDWLYYAGAAAPGAIAVGDTTVIVDDATKFVLTTDVWGNRSADLVITGRLADGRPDWVNSEQVVLTDVDPASATLTITRGAYGTAARAFAAGAYVACHAAEGPWSPQDDRLWGYNFAATAPRGPDGRSAAQRIAAEMAVDFGPGGSLARFDGLELDVYTIIGAPKDRSRLDADGDGVADGAFAPDGTDLYLAGQIDWVNQLKAAIGSRVRVLAVDGARGQRPDARTVSGIEEEGFPSLSDSTLTAWSTADAALEYWAQRGHRPSFSYPLAKTARQPTDPVSFTRFRVTLAAALLAGTQFSFWDEPGGSSCDGLRLPPEYGNFLNKFTIWDELVQDATPGWLGAPTAAAVHVATTRPDLLAGAGVTLTPAFVSQLTVTGCTVTRLTPAALRVTPAGPFSVTIPISGFTGGDLVVVFDVDGAADTDPPAVLGRPLNVLMTAGATTALATVVAPATYQRVRCYAHDLAPGAVSVRVSGTSTTPLQLRAITAHVGPDAGYRTFEHGAVFVNPGSQPYTFDLTGWPPYRRLLASPEQDPATNDGSAVTNPLTIPARDALIVHAT